MFNVDDIEINDSHPDTVTDDDFDINQVLELDDMRAEDEEPLYEDGQFGDQ